MKIDRLLSIAMLLLHKRSTTVGALARQFGVAERTIYRDLAQLDCAGFQIESSPGRGGGIGLPAGFRLERVLLGRESFSIFASTLDALSGLFQESPLRGDADLLSEAADESFVRLDFDGAGFRELGPTLRALVAAQRESRCVALDYLDASGKPTRRTVEPLKLVFWNGDWYLQAWCRLREAYRLFRVRRIEDIDPRPDFFDRLSRLVDLPDLEFEPRPDEPKIVLRVRSDRSDLARRFSAATLRNVSDDWVEIEIDWPIDEWLESHLAGMAPDVLVERPLDLRDRVRSRLEQGLAAYSGEP